MGPENKEWNFFFWPPNVFFSDWRVGRKRPPGKIWAISVVRNIFEKNLKSVKSGQKVFTACRRGLKVCGREIGMSRSVIDQLRWEGVDRHDLTPPTHFMRVLNFTFLGSFHCITCVGGESASTWVAQNYPYNVPYMGRYFLHAQRASYAKWSPPTHFLKLMLELRNLAHSKGNESRMTNIYITRSLGITRGH